MCTEFLYQNMYLKGTLVLLTSVWLVSGQRPSFAGTKPIGFPELEKKPTDPLGNRFGDGTPVVLPIEANGDRDLIDRISKMPIDQQPFWYINWKALEENRKNPQTYEPRPNVFTGLNTNRGQNTATNTATNTDNFKNRFSSSEASDSSSSSSEYDRRNTNLRGRRYNSFS